MNAKCDIMQNVDRCYEIKLWNWTMRMLLGSMEKAELWETRCGDGSTGNCSRGGNNGNELQCQPP